MPSGTISMARRQRNLLNSGFLDLSGQSKLDFKPLSLDATAQTLAGLGIEFATIARDKLNQRDLVASGALSDSIVPTQVQIFGKVFQISINVASYYKFVDQGVKGWANEKGGNSPYQFKQYAGKGNGNSVMVTAIRKWLIKEGLKGTGKENKHPRASRRDNARASITDTSTTTAIIISKSIRKKGLKPSHFWTDTEKEIRDRIRNDFAKALKIDVINNLTNT